MRKTQRGDLQVDFTLADNSKQAPSCTWMFDFMVKTKLGRKCWPCSYSPHPNHKVGTQVSANHRKYNVCKHTYCIHKCEPIWHVLNQRLSWAVLAVAIRTCDHSKGEILRQGEKKESEERQEQTNKTNLVKPSAWLALGMGVCVHVRRSEQSGGD